MLREAFQDLNRLRQIAAAVARHGFGAYLARSRLAEQLGPDGTPASPPPQGNRSTAARFRELLAELGPTFVKLGQLLSTRRDVLPARWIAELELLQDDCPPLPLAEVRRAIERSLGRPVEVLFAELDPAPLASASIAQVHRARTHDGLQVVVKVQRPDIRARIDADLDLLYYLARLLEAVIEETGVYTPTAVIEEFDRTIHEELDFENEARNARAMRAAAEKRPGIVIPAVHEDLSSSHVLTLDYVEGTRLNQVTAEAGFDTERIARQIIEAAFRQLFEDGLFHGDPHPGNILVLADDGIALLDFGLVGRLTRLQQETLVTLIVAVALRDPDSMARLLEKLGGTDARAPAGALRGDIADILDRYLGLKLDEIRTATLLGDLLDLAVRHRIRVPKEYAVLAKAAMTVEGIIRRLYPRLDILEVGLPYAKELLLARFNPQDASGILMRSLLRLQGMAEDVPQQLSQILADLEGGKLRVNVRSPDVERLSADLRSVGTLVFFGLVVSALTVGGLVTLGLIPSPVPGLAALGLAALLGTFALLLHLAPLRLRKISLRRFIPRQRSAPPGSPATRAPAPPPAAPPPPRASAPAPAPPPAAPPA
jgi:ubiquinone biosynthesis protein